MQCLIIVIPNYSQVNEAKSMVITLKLTRGKEVGTRFSLVVGDF